MTEEELRQAASKRIFFREQAQQEQEREAKIKAEMEVLRREQAEQAQWQMEQRTNRHKSRMDSVRGAVADLSEVDAARMLADFEERPDNITWRVEQVAPRANGWTMNQLRSLAAQAHDDGGPIMRPEKSSASEVSSIGDFIRRKAKGR